MQDIALKLGDAMIYYCGFITVFFIVAYSMLAKWWTKRSEFGRHLFFFMLTIACCFLYIIIIKLFGKFPGWEWFRLALMVALAAVLTWRVWILIVVQIKSKRQA